MKRRIIVGPDTRFLRLGGRPARVTGVLLAVQAALFLLYVFADGPAWVLQYAASSVQATLEERRYYQPLTALLWHLEPRGLLIDLLALWVFGSALERWWGPRRFVAFYATTGVAGLVVGLAASAALASDRALVGSAGSAVAILVAVAILFPRHLAHLRQVLGVTVRTLAALFGGFLLVGTLMLGAWVDLAVQLGGGAVALLFLYPPKQLLARVQLRRTRRRLQVVRGGAKDDRYVN